MARKNDEWIGKTDDSMPTVAVQLRICERQGNICACGCGLVMDFDRDEIDCDHKRALKDGGENRESNLQMMFRKHHREKTRGENVARAKANRHKAKALSTVRRAKSSFQTNRDGLYKKKMNGQLMLRAKPHP